MKKFTILIFTLLLLLGTSRIFAYRGEIVSWSPLPTATPEIIMQNLQLNMDPVSFSLIDMFTCKKHSVTPVKVIYNTIDGNGNPILASGVVFLPAVGTVTYMPVFSYLHGTLTKDTDVPSYLTGIESIIGWVMSMDGYISVLPDYIGMGDGPGVHPYCHAVSEASASVDLMKAALLLCSNPLVMSKPNGDLYLSGYSQGAHAALATQRELEQNPIPGLTLQKTVAGSGAYSLSYIQKKFLFNSPYYPNPSFLPYILFGYQDVYGNLYSNLNQVFKSPYNSTIPPLFDGSLNVEEIDSHLPLTWESMFKQRYLRGIKYNYFHPVNVALRENDVINWKPVNDLHLYYCTCDEKVAKENSLLAYLSFLFKGSWNVTCLPVGPFNHNDCAPYVMVLAKIKFDNASGNSCAPDLAQLLSLNKSASNNDMSMFASALNDDETLPLSQVYSNNLVTEYFNNKLDVSGVLNIYPNPAFDKVYIEIPSDLSLKPLFSMYDIQGKIIHCETVTVPRMVLNVNHLKNGLYKVVLNGEKTYTATLIVAK